MPRAVVLVSGGLDSATTLAIARSQDFACYALSFDYGQRHRVELKAARRVAESQDAVVHKTVQLDIGWMGGSALTDPHLEIPQAASTGIPITYVPARNSIFLAIALGWAEVLQAHDIFIGVNAVDYSGYPDCRPQFLQTFQDLANLGTRMGVEGQGLRLHAPLVHLSKAEIIATGLRLGVDYAPTVSCYSPDAEGRACRHCDSCRLRAAGFTAAGVSDPTRYQPVSSV